MKKRLTAIAMNTVLALLVSIGVFAQQTTSGILRSPSGEPLIGATITVKGTTRSVVTDANGRFTIEAAPGSSLVVSSVGYQQREISVTGTELNEVLQMSETALNEVVVIGYQTVRRRDLTGATAVINPEHARRNTSTTLAESIQGLAPGVTVRSGGRPGQEAAIEIRGVGTFGNNAPLYVIDGMPSEANRDFNPNDIESIQILKDASAAAIYGSRAANGVIIITTKKGKEGPMMVSGSARLGIQQFPKTWDLMNASEWIAANKQAFTNMGEPAPTYETTFDTDWQKEVLQTGSIQDYNATLSGGARNANYLISANYFTNKGSVIGTGFDRINLRVNTSGERGRFRFGQFLLLSHAHEDEMHGNPIIDMVYMMPVVGVQHPGYISADNPEGWGIARGSSINYASNPVALQKLTQADRYNYRLRGTAFAEVKLFDWLTYKYNFGTELDFFQRDFFQRRNSVRYATAPGTYVNNQGRDERSTLTSFLNEHTVNFDKTFGPHRVSAVVGYSQQTWNIDNITGVKENFLTNYRTGETYQVLNAAQGTNALEGGLSKWAILGYLGRLNYNFADKYLASFTFRRDGDSRFGAKYRWGNFPSASAAWRISREEFFNMPDWMSDLKLRASYGQLGNTSNLTPWRNLTNINLNPTYTLGTDQHVVSGATQTVVTDPDLHWESKKTINVGLEATLFDNRLSVTMDWYKSTANDVLTFAQISAVAGGNNFPFGADAPPTTFTNAASIQNSGFEFATTYRSGGDPFRWDVTFNVTTIKNKVLSVGYQGNADYLETNLTRTRIGYPVGEWYLRQTAGLFASQQEIDTYVDKNGNKIQPDAKPGDIRYVDVDEDGSIDDDDRTFAGSPWPKLQTGLLLNAATGNLTFAVQLYGVFGNKIYNQSRNILERFTENANYIKGVTYGTDDRPRLILGPSAEQNGLARSDRWLESGSYVRVRNVEIGYALRAGLLNRISVNNARIYVSGQNLFTFTKYSGLDPDIANGDIFLRGFDDGLFPSQRMFMIGAQFGF